MLRTLFKRNDGVDYSEHLKLKLEAEYLRIQLEDKEKEVRFLRATHRDVPIAGFDDLTVEPPGGESRAQFIADVKIFYENILHRKIKVSIAEVRELLSNIGRQEGTPLSMSRVEYDMFLRGMEAAFWKIHDWASGLDGESKQPLQDKANDYGGI